MFKYCLLIIFSFSAIVSIYGQSSVLFEGEIPFKMSLNKIEQHHKFETQFYLDSLSANNKYYAEITFKKDSTIKRTTLYLFDDGFIHLYKVSKNGLQMSKMQPELSYQIPDNITKGSYTGKALPLIAAIDTTKKDTSYIPPFEEYYKLDDYTGKIGCPFPIKDDELAEIKRIVIAENLEDNKLEKAKINIQEMDSACIMVEQTQQIIVLFEYEETKLNFAKYMYKYTFDLENYTKLSEVFNFENSMDELLWFIKGED